MKKEPWDSSDELAKTLSVEAFGFFEQVRIIAHMNKQSETYAQARKILSSLIGHPMISRSGLRAAISRK